MFSNLCVFFRPGTDRALYRALTGHRPGTDRAPTKPRCVNMEFDMEPLPL